MGLRAWLAPPLPSQRSTTGQDQKEPEQEQRALRDEDWLTDIMVGGRTASGQRVTVHKTMGLAPVWSAVKIISESLGTLPLKVYRKMPEHDAEMRHAPSGFDALPEYRDHARAEARDHRAWRLLHDKPNSVTPADRFWTAVTSQLLLWGNAFLRKQRTVGGVIDQLWLLNPTYMTVEFDPIAQEKRFVYENPTELEAGRRRIVYTQDDVLHIFGLSLDGLIGESVIGRCKSALGNALARDEFEGNFWSRGAVLSGLIEHPGKLGQEAAMTLKDSFNTIYGGSGQAHQTGVLEEGATFNTVSNPLRDLQFVENAQLSRTDIAIMFGLPAGYLGGSTGDSLTYSTVEQNKLDFATRAIAPWAHVIANALSHDDGLLPQGVHHAEFVLDAMMRGDSVARAGYYEKMRAMGAMTVNEIRARENMPPLEPSELPPEPVAPTPATPRLGDAASNGSEPKTVKVS